MPAPSNGAGVETTPAKAGVAASKVKVAIPANRKRVVVDAILFPLE